MAHTIVRPDARTERRADFDVAMEVRVKLVNQFGPRPLEADGGEEVLAPCGVEDIEEFEVVKQDGDDVFPLKLSLLEICL